MRKPIGKPRGTVLMVQGRKKDHEKNEIVNAMALKSPLGPVLD
jgi:hypothetical protein